MSKVPKQGRGSPQTLPAAKPTRRRKPLSDRNSSSSTSSDAPLPPRGCFRFLLSNSNSRSTPRKSPKPNEQSSASSSRPRYRSRAPALGNGGKDQSSQEIAKNGGTCTRPPENGTHPCPSSSSNGNYTISTPGRVNEQAPPVQASISPEIHCGSEVVKDGSACFAAGHLVSKVKDRRKCRPRGILTVGENVKLGVEMDCKVNASAIVPIPAEASVRWLESPGDAKGSSQNGSSTSPSCSPRDGIEVGKDGRFRKLGWGMSGQTGVDRCCDAKADAGNGSFASPWNDTGKVIQYKCGSLFDQNKAAHCHKYGCEDEESTKSGLHDSPGVEAKVEFENKGGPREATNSCVTGSYSEDSPKKSFAFDRDELILGETMWFRDKDCSDSLELGHGTGGGDDHNCCRSGESPQNGSFVFSGLVCFPSDEVELGFQYNWARSPSNFRAEDGTLECELRSKNSFRSDKYEVAITHSENKPTQSLLESEISDPTFGHEAITNHPEVNRRQSLPEVEISPLSVGYEDIAPDIKAVQSLSEDPCSSGTESAPARCHLQSTSKALSTSSESNYRKRHQNHPDKQTCCIEFQENRHEEASPISEETSFCECNKLLGCADTSESTGTHKYGVTVGGGNMLDVDQSREASLVPREKPSSESRRLLSKHRSESDGKVGHQDCSSTGNKCSKLDLRKCKEGSLVIQEAPFSEDKEPFSCLNISEISPVSSPFSDGSLWNQNAMCTPSTDSDVGSFEPNSMDEVLRTLRETHDRSDFLPLPGFDFRFYCPATPHHSANGARVWDPSTDLDAIRLEELHERGNALLSPTFDNISHMRISWREGLVSRMFEMDAPDIRDWKLEAEGKTHSEFDFDHDPNLGSPVLDDEKLLQLGSGFGSFELLNEPQDRVTKDIDWKLCYRNSLFEEAA